MNGPFPVRHATVIGAGGFIGSHLLARLHGEGWQCWAPRRDDPQLWRRDLGHVFYCAGLMTDHAERPHAAVEAHASLLNRVLCDTQFDSLVYLSSTRLYDGLGDVEASEDLPLKLSPDDPRQLYALSKALGESLCRVAGRGRARVARLSSVWGDAPVARGFLPGLLRRVLAEQALPGAAQPPRVLVDSSPQLARDYVHIDDVLDALVALATQGEFTIYNVAGGRNTTNAQLFARVAAASGCEIVPAPSRGTPAPLPRISIARMAAEFGWHPGTVLDQVGRLIERESRYATL